MEVYKRVKEFVRRYPGTIAFRLKSHSKILERHLNPGEKLLYIFAGQKNNSNVGLPNTFIVGVTNERLVFARKRLLFGYFFYAITPDLFNDLKVESGLLWGQIIIDTVKELATMSNISISALSEIETAITENMMKEKKKYAHVPRDSK